MYVLHMHLVVKTGLIELKGFWTSRTIKISRDNIVKIRKSRYKSNIWRPATYNLHSKGIIRFYTSGQDFIEITDKQGFVYRIGSHHADQLYSILNENTKNKP